MSAEDIIVGVLLWFIVGGVFANLLTWEVRAPQAPSRTSMAVATIAIMGLAPIIAPALVVVGIVISLRR